MNDWVNTDTEEKVRIHQVYSENIGKFLYISLGEEVFWKKMARMS